MADEVSSASVEPTPAEAPAQDTPGAEETLTQQIQDAETASESEQEVVTDANSGGEKEQQEESIAVDYSLLVRASRLGLSEEQVSSFRTPEDLAAAVALLESRSATNATQHEAKEATQAQAVKPPAQDIKDPEWKLDGLDGVDESIVKALNGVPQFVKDYVSAQLSRQSPELEKLRGELKQATEYIRESQAQAIDSQMDQWFASQGPEWEKTFGKGTVDDLDPKSTAFAARQKMFQRAQIQEQAYLAAGKRPPSLAKLLDEAKAIEFAQQAAAQERKKVLLRAKPAKGVVLARPSNKAGVPGSDEAESKTLDHFKQVVGSS